MSMRPILFALALCLHFLALGQDAVQVSGVILAQDSARQTIPNAKIQVKGRPLLVE